MKNFIRVFVAAFALVACSSRQVLYKGNVQLTQDGKDCVIEMTRNADFSERAFDKRQRVVHKNTKCIDMIEQRKTARSVTAEPARIPEQAPAAQPVVEAEAEAAQQVIVIVPVHIQNEIRNETANAVAVSIDNAIEDMRARQVHSAVWAEPRPAPRPAPCRPAQPCGRPRM